MDTVPQPGFATVSRPTTKGERTAQRILDAAEALFAEHGYPGTTLRDVARAVRLRIPSLYNHFNSKEGLYAAVLERGIGPVLALLTSIVESPESERTDPTQIVSQIMELLGEHPNLPRLILHETLSGGQRLTPMLREWIAPVFAKSFDLVSAQIPAQRWEREEIPLVVLALYHIVLGYFTIAPLYRELNGEDLLSDAARLRQTRFLAEVVELLMAERDSAYT